MKLLALDTSSVACSVALRTDDLVIERHEEQAREHTRLLLPMIRAVLDESGVKPRELDGIALGNGPGSFIGMRIGASVAQGLAHGSGLNIVPVSSLAAVAAQVFAEHDATEVVVAQDAHMQEVYVGGFTRGVDDLPDTMFAERLLLQEAIAELGETASGNRVAAGEGWHRYPALLQANQDRLELLVGILYPRARWLLGLAQRALIAGEAISPTELTPAYLRHKVAEVPAQRS
jgi:tRNA threonylcarbamoyladenosine biosynthesis protein TsaB